MRLPLFVVVALVPVCGCAHLEPLSQAKLSAPTPAKNSVVLDVLFVRFPLGDPEANEAVWSEIDELRLPADERRRLEANGFRAGVISGPLPLPLERLLQLGATPPAAQEAQTVDVEQAPPARQRRLQTRGGRRANIIVMGERQRHDELSVLLRTEDDRVQGRTYRQVMGLYAAKAFPQGDGGIRLEMTPELEHGEARKRFTSGEGMFRVEFGPPHEVLEQLRSTAHLTPGEILAVTTFPKRPGTLGHHFFTESDGDAVTQKMLLVRLAQCEYDDRFQDGPATAPADDGE
jgi:hypothetical protein